GHSRGDVFVTCLAKHRDVKERIASSGFGRDETESLGGVAPLHSTTELDGTRSTAALPCRHLGRHIRRSHFFLSPMNPNTESAAREQPQFHTATPLDERKYRI